ncbi:MAG: TolC family protein [Proteobacteria bacterium]|nr:TolC family protein [Pseudomonadota bacterium]
MRTKVLFVLLLISGCSYLPAIGPDYEKPKENLPEQYYIPIEDKYFEKTDRPLGKWWNSFSDDVLNELIERTIENNKDIKIALSRIEQSRLQFRITKGIFLPDIDKNFSFSRKKFSENSAQRQASDAPFNSFDHNFDFSWEIDFFGGDRRRYLEAEALHDASKENHRDVIATTIAETARRYFDLLALRRRVVVAEENIKAQQESIELVQVRYNAGLVSELDLLQAKAQVESTEAALHQLLSQEQELINSLAILLGDDAISEKSVFRSLNLKMESLEKDFPKIALAFPSTVLRSRGDVQKVERNLAAAINAIGVAESDYFPKFIISGYFGGESEKPGDLFHQSSQIWNIAPSVHWPIFRGGRVTANLHLEEERAKQAQIEFEKVVLVAFSEVSAAIRSYQEEIQRFDHLSKSLVSNKRSLALANDLYLKGLTDFIRVLDAQRAVFSSEDAFTQSKSAIRIKAIAIYKALGAGVV